MTMTPTPYLSIDVPVPGSLEPFRVSDYVDAIVALDAEFQNVATAATLLKGRVDVLEPKVTALEGGAGRAPGAIFTVTTPAALDLLATAVVGDYAWMTTPGTGISPLQWVASAGAGGTIDWQPLGPVISDTKANLDSFISVVAALTADIKFEIGGHAVVTAANGRLYRFTSAVGALRATEAMVPIIPTSVVGTGVVLGANGVVTGTAVATSFSINGCFTTEFDQYLVIFEGTNPVGSTITGRLRASGTDSSAGYDKNVLYTSESGASGASLESNLAQWPMSLYGLPLNRLLKFDFHGPALAVGTKVITDYNETNNAGAIARSVASLYHRTASAFDGVTFFLTASSHTFTVRIFGYNKN